MASKVSAAQKKVRSQIPYSKPRKTTLRVVVGGKSSGAKKLRTSPTKKVTKKPSRPQRINREALILDHRENGRKLARSLLRRWRVRMPSEEIDSIVDLTLCEAALRYAPNHGASFMTFLFYHLRGNLVRAVATATKLNNFVVSYAKNAGIDAGDLALLGENSPRSMFPDVTAFEQQESDIPEQQLLKQERVLLVQKACSQLDELEQEVLNRSFVNEEALIDVARTLGYSRCHISRVKKRALDRLKEILNGYYDVSHSKAEGNSTEEVDHSSLETESDQGSVIHIAKKDLIRRTRRRRGPAHQPVADEAYESYDEAVGF